MSAEKRIEELASEIESLRSEFEDVAAIEEPTQDESERFDRLANDLEARQAEHTELVERAKRAERARTLLSKQPEKVERGFHAPEVIVKKDPFDVDPEHVRSMMLNPRDMVGRARAAIDEDKLMPSDASRERAYGLAGSSAIARHMLLTGSPTYRSAFQKWLRNPSYGMGLLTPDEQHAVRAALSTTDANGGYLIPQQLDPTIILTNDGSHNPFRQIARVEPGTSDKWEGVSSAGVTAEWLAEGSQAADASPTFAAPTVTAEKASAYVFASYEALGDTNFESQLPRLLSDAKDRLEAVAFATGDGSDKPTGVVTAVAAVTASRVDPTTGGTFTTASVADVYSVYDDVPPRAMDRVAWVGHHKTFSVIRQMDQYGGGSFWANLGQGMPEQLLGAPVYKSSAMDSAVTTGSNLLLAGDFSEYLIYDRVGMSLVYDPVVQSTSNNRPTGQAGFFAFWRVGGGVTNANAFRVLQL